MSVKKIVHILRILFNIVLSIDNHIGWQWIRVDKLFHYKELLKAMGRVVITYLVRHNPNLLDSLRKYLRRSRYNFTIDSVRWLEDTKVKLYIGSGLHTEVYGAGEYEKKEMTFLKKH